MFEYAAKVERVVDGDTLVLLLDLGFHVFARERVRLRDVYVAENNTIEGKRAAEFVRALVEGKEVVVNTHRDRSDSFGRYLADVRVGDVDVNARLRVTFGSAGRGSEKKKTVGSGKSSGAGNIGRSGANVRRGSS